MTFWRILFLTIVSLLACLTLSPNAYGNGPKAVISEKEHHFGKAMVGDTVSHVFKLKNAGDLELTIENIEITDVFTKIMFKRSIPPGQEIDITLILDTGKVKGEIETGAILSTNDPTNPLIELKMWGRIHSLIDILPMSAIFFSVYKGESQAKSVNLVNNDKKPFQITKIESLSNRFNYKLKTVKEGQEYQFLVKVNPKASLGRTMEKATLFTNNEKIPQFDIGVNIFVKDDVYNFPDDINFGTIDLEKLKKNPQLLDLLIQTILVKRREGKGSDFQIKLEHNIPFIDIKKDPESGSETYRLDVSLVLDKMTKGKIDTFIKVITNDKEVPELKIPVKGEII
jgi:hypothetical protein